MLKLAMTPFALRHWDPTSGTGQIEGLTPDTLIAACETAIRTAQAGPNHKGDGLTDGYAPFCKHIFIPNTSQMRCAFAPITDDNIASLRTGYIARRPGELAVLERWFESGTAPKANFLDVILYSHAQLEKEAAAYPEHETVPDCDWGVVAIIGTLEAHEPPMPPITQMRNALGMSEGGSGIPINRDAYDRAVAFWETHAPIK